MTSSSSSPGLVPAKIDEQSCGLHRGPQSHHPVGIKATYGSVWNAFWPPVAEPAAFKERGLSLSLPHRHDQARSMPATLALGSTPQCISNRFLGTSPTAVEAPHHGSCGLPARSLGHNGEFAISFPWVKDSWCLRPYLPHSCGPRPRPVGWWRCLRQAAPNWTSECDADSGKQSQRQWPIRANAAKRSEDRHVTEPKRSISAV